MKKMARVCLLAIAAMAVSGAQADYTYTQDFSLNASGWTGLGGTVTHNSVPETATVVGGAYTTFGGYNYGAGGAIPTVFQEYYTSLDVYLDFTGPWADNTRFDWSSAINNSLGTHRRDFIFNAAFFNDSDLTGPGAGTDRFVISASNNSQPGSAFAKNPARNPVAISTSGWYTFEHHFYDNNGVLAVDMSIFDSSNALVNTWTLSDPSDLIGQIGGNRYGWIDYNEFGSGLRIDNTHLETVAVVPIPGAAGLGLLGLALVGARRRFRKVA